MKGYAPGFDPGDDYDEIVPVDWPTFYTPVPVWVLFAADSAQAYRTYAFLAEHINNRVQGQRIACPKQKYIARALHLKNPRQVRTYTEELEAIDAIRVEEYRYHNGMRRGYRYHVRFNPPPDHSGPLSLPQWYEVNADLRTANIDGRTQAAFRTGDGESAGRTGGTKNSTSGATADGTFRGAISDASRGASYSTAKPNQEEDLNQEQHAPPARSAADARRAPHLSTGRGSGGSAAPGRTASRSREPSPDAVRQLLPAPLAQALPARIPGRLRSEIAAQLDQRTAEQLAARTERRWTLHGYAAHSAAEGLNSPVGVAFALIRPGECPDTRCEDGANIDTGGSCPRCAERKAERRAAAARQQPEAASAALQATAAKVPRPRTTALLKIGSGAPPTEDYRKARSKVAGRAEDAGGVV